MTAVSQPRRTSRTSPRARTDRIWQVARGPRALCPSMMKLVGSPRPLRTNSTVRPFLRNILYQVSIIGTHGNQEGVGGSKMKDAGFACDGFPSSGFGITAVGRV